MKKTIALIMMFVLSAGFLMAQVFTYQAVVVDNQGRLVVNQTVTAQVTINYGDPVTTYNQTITNIHTSGNGLAVFSIGEDSPAFKAIDWKTAKMQVNYTVTSSSDITVQDGTLEQVPAVPYALQSNADLTTPMIVEYVKNATMEDVDAILNAMVQGTPIFRDTLLATAVDTVKANYKLAKQVFLDYVSNATPADVKKLYDSLRKNQEVMAAIDTILVHFLKDSTEMVYDILSYYATHLTPDDAADIMNAVQPNVRDYMLNKVIEFLMKPEAKTKILIPVIMDYAKNIENSEVEMLIEAVKSNPEGYPLMLAQFNTWMDEYFANHYTGGSNVEDVVADSIEDRYYVCNENVNLCQLKSDLEALTASTCFDPDGDGFDFRVESISGVDYIVGKVRYEGPNDPNAISVNSLTVVVNNNPSYTYPIDINNVTIDSDADGKYIEVMFTEDDIQPFDVGDSAAVTLEVTSECNGSEQTYSIEGTYNY